MPEIQNGNIIGDKSRTHGSIRFFSCNPGYHLVGPIISRCFVRRWTQKQPQCLRKNIMTYSACITKTRC